MISGDEARAIMTRIINNETITRQEADDCEAWMRAGPLFDPHSPIDLSKMPGRFIDWPAVNVRD